MTAVLERPTAAAAAPGTAKKAGVWAGFGVVLAAMIMNILDSTIVNIAAPSIQRDLDASASALEWVAAAYTLAIAIGLLTGGRLGDMFGRKRMLLTGIVGFVASSALCALAWSPEALIGARALQGLAAACLIPQTFGLIRDIFGPEQIGKAFAAFGPVIGLSTVAGPVVAGLLIKLDLFGTDWRALFLINIPVGIYALVVGAKVLPSGHHPRPGLTLDVRGTVLMALASFLLVFPLVDGRTLGWPVWIFAVLISAVPVLGLFAAHQRRRVRAGRSPLVELSLLRKRSYVSGVLFTLVFFGSVVGLGLTLGLFLQIGLGQSAMTASLYSVALAVGAFLGSGIGAWAASAIGRPILHIGLTIMATGTVVLYLSLRGASEVGFWTLTPGLFVFGFGMGMIFVPLFSIVVGEIDDHEVGSASGLLESLQQLGASLGIAVLGTVFFSTIALEDGGPKAAMAAGRNVLAAERTLLVTLVLIAVAFALGWLLPKKPRAEH